MRCGDDQAVSAQVGVVLMVGIVTAVAAGVVLFTDMLIEDVEAAPVLAMDKNEATAEYIVLSISDHTDWSDLTVKGCTAPSQGQVGGGQRITSCAGRITIVHEPSGQLIWDRSF